MPEAHDYSINLDVRFKSLELVDVAALASKVTEEWFNQTLCRVNDCVVRVGVFKKGEFHWHKHDTEDEFFFVLQGSFVIEYEKKRIVLKPHQGFGAARGPAQDERHRARSHPDDGSRDREADRRLSPEPAWTSSSAT